MEDVCKVNDELLLRIKAEQDAARLARQSIEDLKARADASQADLESKAAGLRQMLDDARQAQHAAERESIEARERALAQIKEAESARRLAEAELKAMQGLGSAAAADRQSNYAVTAAAQEELARVQHEMTAQAKALQHELEQAVANLTKAQKSAAEEAEAKLQVQARADDLARALAVFTSTERQGPTAATDDGDPDAPKALASAADPPRAVSYSGLPGDVRAELLELRLARRLHSAEVERLEAKQADLQARTQGLIHDLSQVQKERSRLLSEAVDGEKLRRTATVAQQRAQLLEEELRQTHSRLSKEVSQRSRAEAAMANTAIDLKHAEARLAEVTRELEKREREVEARANQAGFGGIEWFDPMHSLGHTTSASQMAASTRAMGPYASLLQPEKPFAFGSLSAPPQPGETPVYYASPQVLDFNGGRSAFDHMQDARLAEQRAKAAEKREATLLAKLKAVELAAANAPGRPGDAAGVVSLSVHTQLLDLAEQRARDAERRVKELETELVSLRAQLRSAEGLHLAMRSQEVADSLEARLDACLSLADMLVQGASGAANTVAVPAVASVGKKPETEGMGEGQEMNALLERLQRQAEANAREAMALRAQASVQRAASPQVFKLPPSMPVDTTLNVRDTVQTSNFTALPTAAPTAQAEKEAPPPKPRPVRSAVEPVSPRRPLDGASSPTPSSPTKLAASPLPHSPRSPKLQVSCCFTVRLAEVVVDGRNLCHLLILCVCLFSQHRLAHFERSAAQEPLSPASAA